MGSASPADVGNADGDEAVTDGGGGVERAHARAARRFHGLRWLAGQDPGDDRCLVGVGVLDHLEISLGHLGQRDAEAGPLPAVGRRPHQAVGLAVAQELAARGDAEVLGSDRHESALERDDVGELTGGQLLAVDRLPATCAPVEPDLPAEGLARRTLGGAVAVPRGHRGLRSDRQRRGEGLGPTVGERVAGGVLPAVGRVDVEHAGLAADRDAHLARPRGVDEGHAVAEQPGVHRVGKEPPRLAPVGGPPGVRAPVVAAAGGDPGAVVGQAGHAVVGRRRPPVAVERQRRRGVAPLGTVRRPPDHRLALAVGVGGVATGHHHVAGPNHRLHRLAAGTAQAGRLDPRPGRAVGREPRGAVLAVAGGRPHGDEPVGHGGDVADRLVARWRRTVLRHRRRRCARPCRRH